MYSRAEEANVMPGALSGSRRASALALLLAAAIGCGASPPPAAAQPRASERRDQDRDSGGPSVESETGGLDEAGVKKTFERAAGELSACFNKGTERLPYLSGEVRFVLR